MMRHKKLYSLIAIAIYNIGVSSSVNAAAKKAATMPDINFYYERYAYQKADEPDYLNLSKSGSAASDKSNTENNKWSYQKSDNSLENRINNTDSDEDGLPLESKAKSSEKPKPQNSYPFFADDEDLEGQPYNSGASLRGESAKESEQLERYYSSGKKDKDGDSAALSDIIKSHNSSHPSTTDITGAPSTPVTSETPVASAAHKESRFEYFCEYITSGEDSVASVSTRFHTPLNKFIGQMEDYREGAVTKGTKLVIPVKHYKVTRAKTTFAVIAEEYHIKPEEIKKLNKHLVEPIPINTNVILPIFDAHRQIKTTYPTPIETQRIVPSFERNTLLPSAKNHKNDSTAASVSENKGEKKVAAIPAVAPTKATPSVAESVVPPKPISKDKAVKGSGLLDSEEKVSSPVKNTADIALPHKKPDNLETIEAKVATPVKSKKFIWPLNGKIISSFEDNGDGIHIGANIKTPVVAVADGEVLFSAAEKTNYGNLVIIKHEDNYISVYGHNASLLVKKGQKVKQGDKIALSGKSGSVTVPQLYFSLRHNKKAVNPSKYLEK